MLHLYHAYQKSITHLQDNAKTGATFQINNAKIYVPVVALSTNDIKFLENINQGFKKTIS